jgi:hypothetical protein
MFSRFFPWLVWPSRKAALRPVGRRILALESLEDRALLSVSSTLGDLSASGDVVAVNAGQSVGSVGTPFLGVNLVSWDSYLNTSQTQQMVQNAGLGLFRFPGGSESDEFHFNVPPANQPVYSGPGTAASMASFIASVNGRGIATLDYGSGSPQEAAAFLAYLNAPTTSTAPIGFGEEWSTSSKTWVQTDWKTAGYWAAFRAATPLAHDDGLNFLRAGRSAPFGIHYFEVGNEVYGSWETDYHGQGGDAGKPHDPATYVAFAKQFANYAQQIDPTISIGVDTGGVDTWTANVLQQCASQGFTLGFLSDHNYVQEPGSENDSTLLLHTVSDPANTSLDWANRAAGYRSLLQQKLGTGGAGVELLATEFNSVSYDPGKQTTSLVNGLFTADSLGSLLDAGYTGGVIWDVRNSFETANNNSPSLYGWRQGGDYGLLGSDGQAPSTGPYVPYPTYFAEQLVGKMVQPGDTVVQTSSNDPNLSAYAVQQTNGHLDLLVVNKNAASDLTATFQVSGFQSAAQAQIWQYGKPQDTAQSQTLDGHSALANFATNLPLNGANFTYTFPSYSMTVIDLAVAPATVTGVSTTASANSRYHLGDSLPITVTFSEPVTVTGTPQLTLNAGSGAAAVYSGGSGTSTLTFTYTVAAGQTSSDLDYTSTTALGLNGGSIQDGAGNAGTLTLPAPGTDGLAVKNIVIDTTAPTVTNVLLSSTTWNATFLSYLTSLGSQNVGGYSIPVGSGSQLLPLPWANIDQIKVVFSENVVVDQADLLLSGVNTPAYDVGGGTFNYDPTTFTATWTLPQAMGADKLLLALNADGSGPIVDRAANRLDGEWTNPTSTTQPSSSTYPSGNSAAGGEFLFRFNVLPGDATQDGVVNFTDLSKLLASYGTNSGASWSQGDFTGDGAVNFTDLSKLLAYYGQSLPSGEPPAGSFPAGASLVPVLVPAAVSGSLLKKGTGSEPMAVNTAKHGRCEVPVPLFQQAASTPLTLHDLKPVVREAIVRGAGAGANATTPPKLPQAPFVIGALPASSLGEAEGNRIALDTNAVGDGWFIDPTPASGDEFASSGSRPQWLAVETQVADRIDLWTAATHELEHITGLSDLDALTDDMLSGVLGRDLGRHVSHRDAVLASL